MGDEIKMYDSWSEVFSDCQWYAEALGISPAEMFETYREELYEEMIGQKRPAAPWEKVSDGD